MSTRSELASANASPPQAWVDYLLAGGWLPDPVMRLGIRRLIRERLRQEARGGIEEQYAVLNRFLQEMAASPIALSTDSANSQHYEVPAEFFKHVLGARLKYSCCYWTSGTRSLDEAEVRMLETTCLRADLKDSQTILELGCGWGSLSLYMAERLPRSRIVAVSNSASQKSFIESRASAAGITNLEVITADMNSFETEERFDRVVSVEMFEHMRNWGLLLSRIASWMKPASRLFVHVFSHRHYTYPFVDSGPTDWMARHFFSGGLMPGSDLLPRFQYDLRLARQWGIPGTHYRRTAEAWLWNMDENREPIQRIFGETYGESATRFWHYWRTFFLCCQEVWGYRNGQEWMVSHYLMEKT